eukprot:TRINITY_DN3963_c0_g1_i2.p1 TRINITY_DN3963_c0_g1~~TRINITY_DN3963_c0_g1_i2.p1  ORF type:complete len:347 (-),score=67.44 TRINITY_DN3963_c0_g1_i2:38-1078(-)
MSAAAAPAAAAAAARAHRVVQSVMPVICMVDPPSICPARPALMSVLVSQAWREANSLRPEELYEATRRATCHDPRNMHEVACSVCSHAKAVGKVVTIANFDKLQRVDGNTGTERYLFEIHALCASSRCHLGYAKVVLAMQYGPLCVNSNAFQLIGRERESRKKGKSNTQSHSRQSFKYMSTEGNFANTDYVLAHSGDANTVVMPTTPTGTTINRHLVVILYRHSVKFSLPLARSFVMSTRGLKLRSGFMTHRILLSLTSPTALRTALAGAPMEAFQPIFAGEPVESGDPNHYFAVHVTICDTRECAQWWLDRALSFIRNQCRTKNMLNVDLVSHGVTFPIGVFTSW